MPSYTEEQWLQISRSVVLMLDAWHLDNSQKITLLGLPENTPKRSLSRFKDNTPLPDDAVVTERVEHLLGIADALRTTYPTNQRMGTQWMSKPNRKLNQRSPISMLKEGTLGNLISIRAQLDCVFMWETMGSRA